MYECSKCGAVLPKKCICNKKQPIFTPTQELRMFRSKPNMHGERSVRLQQLWVDCFSHAQEWRDIQVVDEE